eukprot:m.246939 g.246939  ORF g.246939 m.246939 type:complete len:101 (+) comp15858_c0_seq8:387-689(+)
MVPARAEEYPRSVVDLDGEASHRAVCARTSDPAAVSQSELAPSPLRVSPPIPSIFPTTQRVFRQWSESGRTLSHDVDIATGRHCHNCWLSISFCPLGTLL